MGGWLAWRLSGWAGGWVAERAVRPEMMSWPAHARVLQSFQPHWQRGGWHPSSCGPSSECVGSPSTWAPSTRSSGMLGAEVEQKMCRTASARTEVWDGFKLLRTTGGWAAVRD